MVDESLDIFEYANAQDLSRRFESFNADELRVLRVYDRLCREMGESTFFNSSVSLKFSDSVTLDHAGRDALRSLTMSFRQLWAQKDDARFQHVLRLVREHVRADEPELTAVVEELGRRYRVVRREALMAYADPGNEMTGPRKDVPAERVIDDWLAAGNFHSDKQDVFDRVHRWSPEAYDWSLIKALTNAAGVMWELHVLVQAALAGAESEATNAA